MQILPCSHTSHTSHVSRTERRPIDGEILLHQRDLARGAARLTGPPRVLAPQVGRSATSVSHLEQTQGCRSTAIHAVDRQPSGAGCPPPQANGTAPHLYRPDRHRAVPGDEHLLCSTRRTVVIRCIHRAWRCWPFWPAALLFHAVADSGARWAGTCNIGCGRTPERWRVRVRHRTAGGCLEEGAAGSSTGRSEPLQQRLVEVAWWHENSCASCPVDRHMRSRPQEDIVSRVAHVASATTQTNGCHRGLHRPFCICVRLCHRGVVSANAARSCG